MSSKAMDIYILVVFYNCEFMESATVKSLIRVLGGVLKERIGLVFWNNGPQKGQSTIEAKNAFREFDSNVSLDIVDDGSNSPLSRIYNNFLKTNSAPRYCIFDHDTFFEEDFLCCAMSEKFDLMLPHVVVKDRFQGPFYKRKIFSATGSIPVSSANDFFAIGSGMVISENAIDKVKQEYGDAFDERYSLYGVDTSFCIRISSLSSKFGLRVICQSEIKHSLSRLEVEDARRRIFRANERGLDLGITLRNYFSLYWVREVFILTLKSFMNRASFSLAACLKGFVWGRHPRA